MPFLTLSAFDIRSVSHARISFKSLAFHIILFLDSRFRTSTSRLR
jgi:hypothetical protein